MPRTLSSGALQAFYAQETGDYPILLITLTHADLPEPVRISSDPTQRVLETASDVFYGTISRTQTFYHIPFSISLPDDVADAAPKSKVSIDNVSQELMTTIRTVSSRPTVTMELVMASTPNVVEIEMPDFELSDISYDVLVIEGTLSLELFVAEPCPSGRFTPSQFPGMY